MESGGGNLISAHRYHPKDWDELLPELWAEIRPWGGFSGGAGWPGKQPDGLYYMIHTEKVMEVMPMTLPEDGTEHPFPYDTYDTGTREFEKLLLSDEWVKMDEK